MAMGAAAGDDTWTSIELWLTDVIARPDARLGHAGSLCPFIRRSLRADTLLHRSEHVRSAASAADVTLTVLAHLDEFDNQPWPDAPVELRALVVSFPGLTADTAHVLDEVHRLCKDTAVAAGFMLTQFHPAGTVPSVRHPDVAAGTGPIPLMAIRRMAEHEIIFLNREETWVSAYRQRFGDRTLRSAESDTFLRSVLERSLAATPSGSTG